MSDQRDPGDEDRGEPNAGDPPETLGENVADSLYHPGAVMLQDKPDGEVWALPLYECHKTVAAVLIHRVEGGGEGSEGKVRPSMIVPLREEHFPEGQVPDILAPLLAAQEHIGPFPTTPGWRTRYHAKPEGIERGVWVRYDDGYESWSPLIQFLGGYDLITDQ